jgi:transcriptional regulator with XRE-family HTH domain
MREVQPTIGQQLRAWREQRGVSQLDLALAADVSARHLSFVETGRARPGRELLLRLMAELQVPLRERNLALGVAGFAPVFQMRGYQDSSFDPIRAIIDAALERQKPFPAYVIDRHWNVVASNAALPELLEGVSHALLRPPVNIVRIVLHPDGYGDRLLNRPVWRTVCLGKCVGNSVFPVTPPLRRCWRRPCRIRKWNLRMRPRTRAALRFRCKF